MRKATSHTRTVRVLSVIGSLGLGGIETYVARMAQAIKNHGVDMEICTLEREGPMLAGLEQGGVRVYGTPYARRTGQSLTLALLRTVDAIRRIVSAGRFDVVHTYPFWSGVLGVPGARLGGCRRVIITRQSIHSWIHSPKALYHGLEQATNKLAAELVTDSEAVLRDAEANEQSLPPIRAVIYKGVDVDKYRPARPSLEGPLNIVTVGALAPRKGQEYAIEALARITHDGIDAQLVLVGSGPDEAMLRSKTIDAGLGDRVKFAGEHLDPSPYLSAADIFLFPSRQEGFAMALLEAMASALPIVATNVGGSPEALIDGEGGRIVPPQDPAAIAAAITEMARDRTKLTEMGRVNRRRVSELFSLDASARRLADWYLFGSCDKTVSPPAVVR